ncbi:hypothetical protein [Streptomyces sp. NBC_01264]|uniref:hypothetical protein n=1 Tax=Streptomyces sp. NBC_01264 TaxID=2903804 RepID=UPI002251A8AE|nr:hypothetical protein [Streptomyces sp. NBC_01264]MCX4781489.1 hypothetical protein [Streptomyces sp. NBC_01264]
MYATHGINCGTVAQTQTLWYTKTLSSTHSHDFGWETSSTVEVAAADWFKISATNTIKNTWSESVTDTTTFTQQVVVNVPPGKVETLYITPALKIFSGKAEVWINKSQAYTVVPWTWTQPTTSQASSPTWIERSATAAECAAIY